MSKFTDFFLGKPKSDPAQDRSETFLSGGFEYGLQQTLTSTGPVERPSGYSDLAYAYRSNPIVFSCMDVRAKLFSEARFQWRQRDQGRPGKFFGNAELLPLERPWPNADTGDLLSRAINDIDLAGNFYAVRSGPNLLRLRPDWVSIAIDSPSGDPDAIDSQIVGYLYNPNGNANAPVTLLPEQVVHWRPVIDPAFRHRGMSPLTPALADIYADGAMTEFKGRYLDNGAAPSIILTMPPGMNKDSFDQWVTKFKADHGSPADRGKPLFFANGTTATVIGSDLQKIDFKNVSGAGETRIAACLGVPPIIAGLSEGLEAATYSNYGMARRRFFDGTISPLLRSFASSLENVLTVPPGAFLTYDARDIPWLQEDVRDDADIQAVNATAINTLITAGYSPESVVTAVTTNDLSKLAHTGMTSVQLLKPAQQNGSVPTVN